jgi:hypothetical protein
MDLIDPMSLNGKVVLLGEGDSRRKWQPANKPPKYLGSQARQRKVHRLVVLVCSKAKKNDHQTRSRVDRDINKARLLDLTLRQARLAWSVVTFSSSTSD